MRILPDRWTKPLRVWLHVPMGLLWVLLWPIEPVAALATCGLFVRYELNEDKHLKDGAYIDIAGSIIGLVGGTLWYEFVFLLAVHYRIIIH